MNPRKRQAVKAEDWECVVDASEQNAASADDWGKTHGVGSRQGFLGTSGLLGDLLNNLGIAFLLLAAPLATVYT